MPFALQLTRKLCFGAHNHFLWGIIIKFSRKLRGTYDGLKIVSFQVAHGSLSMGYLVLLPHRGRVRLFPTVCLVLGSFKGAYQEAWFTRSNTRQRPSDNHSYCYYSYVLTTIILVMDLSIPRSLGFFLVTADFKGTKWASAPLLSWLSEAPPLSPPSCQGPLPLPGQHPCLSDKHNRNYVT